MMERISELGGTLAITSNWIVSRNVLQLIVIVIVVPSSLILLAFMMVETRSSETSRCTVSHPRKRNSLYITVMNAYIYIYIYMSQLYCSLLCQRFVSKTISNPHSFDWLISKDLELTGKHPNKNPIISKLQKYMNVTGYWKPISNYGNNVASHFQGVYYTNHLYIYQKLQPWQNEVRLVHVILDRTY
jgi:hypothetical protein